jgi:hypothetical protein
MKLTTVLMGVLMAGGGCLTGCQTTSGPAKSGEDSLEGAVIHQNFIPANFVAPVAYEQGQYTTMLSPKTYAVWVDRNIKDLKLAYERQQHPNKPIDSFVLDDAEYISENFIVIECHIESTLPDASIAYDISSLRNLDIYLTTSGGTTIYPLQHVITSGAEEKVKGPLKTYVRSNVLIFPKVDLVTGASTIPADTSELRLYIEGFNTKYFFAWEPQEPMPALAEGETVPQDITDVIRWRPNQTETYQVLSLRFSELYPKLEALTRLPKKAE